MRTTITLVAVATSLPEISTTTTAARRGHLEMAVSNTFGSKAVDITLLALVGLLAGAAAFAGAASPSAVFAAGAGILVTYIYLWGLLEREDRAVLRLAWDSIAVLIASAARVAGVYFLQQ